MKKYTEADISSMRFKVWDKLGYVSYHNAPKLDFFWAPATDRQKTQIIVTLLGKHGQFGISEDEDVFPSDKLITQLSVVIMAGYDTPFVVPWLSLIKTLPGGWSEEIRTSFLKENGTIKLHYAAETNEIVVTFKGVNLRCYKYEFPSAELVAKMELLK